MSEKTPDKTQEKISEENKPPERGSKKRRSKCKVDWNEFVERHFKPPEKSKDDQTESCLVQYTPEEVQKLLLKVKDVLLKQPTLVEIEPPVTIFGDIHGQFPDLQRILLEIGKTPAEHRKLLFLGDYVDRGRQSLECICLLMAYKVLYPDYIYILRGNHECSGVNRVYGFYEEVKRRLNFKIWMDFQNVFQVFPIAGLVAGRIFCMHGGIGPRMTLNKVRKLQRPMRDPVNGEMACDLLWADPHELPGWRMSIRGISYTFGPEKVDEFLEQENLDLICRAHQLVQDGYEFQTDKRRCVTVFSAPNYCNQFENTAAVMHVGRDLQLNFQSFEPSPGKNVVSSRSEKLTSAQLKDMTSTPAPPELK